MFASLQHLYPQLMTKQLRALRVRQEDLRGRPLVSYYEKKKPVVCV